MMPVRAVWPVGAGLAIAATLATVVDFTSACGTVQQAPAVQPFNTCPEHSCDSYEQPPGLAATCTCVEYTTATSSTCQGTMTCAANAQPPTNFFLRVDVPSGSVYAPGTTFLILEPLTAIEPSDQCPYENPNHFCLELPALSVIHGSLLVQSPTPQEVGFNLGNGDDATTTLPVTATVTQILKLPGAAAAVDASAAGVLLQPPLVSQISPPNGEYPNAAPWVGPYGASGVGYFAPTGPGVYDITLLPVAPFDAYFPPMSLGLLTIEPGSFYNQTFASVDQASSRATNVRSVTALDGLVAYLRNAAGERISTRVPLHGQDAVKGVPVQLQTSGQADITSDFFVIAPADATNPGGRATFTNTALSITSGGLGTEQTYPQLPTPVSVAGQVFATGSIPTAADVVLTSTGIDRVDQPAPDDTSLSYSASFTTDVCGNYTVILPPGTYSALVTPHLGAQTCGQVSTIAPAQSVTTLDVATTPAVQNGKSLALDDAIPLSGTCHVADGRPLGGATVVLSPSTSLAASPEGVPPPRSFSVPTDQTGTFSVDVDPGLYDVSVQPAGGSNLPWVVTTRQPVTAPGFALADQIVPAPVRWTYTLFQPNSNQVIANALVTAYAVPLSPTDAGTTGRGAAVPIAQGTTDVTGTVHLLFAGSPQ